CAARIRNRRECSRRIVRRVPQSNAYPEHRECDEDTAQRRHDAGKKPHDSVFGRSSGVRGFGTRRSFTSRLHGLALAFLTLGTFGLGAETFLLPFGLHARQFPFSGRLRLLSPLLGSGSTLLP